MPFDDQKDLEDLLKIYRSLPQDNYDKRMGQYEIDDLYKSPSLYDGEPSPREYPIEPVREIEIPNIPDVEEDPIGDLFGEYLRHVEMESLPYLRELQDNIERARMICDRFGLELPSRFDMEVIQKIVDNYGHLLLDE
ncbi:hypothetical protein GF312_00410 [Candidatus Poribacteria bacterium]|nr:hypothetical protein [Candidatus Poribacteria bacterium]